MPTVKIFISDLRVPVGRQFTAIVRCARQDNQNDAFTQPHELITVVERVSKLPIEILLSPGNWFIFVKSAYFEEDVETITVSDVIYEQTISVTIGKDAKMRKQFRYEPSDEKHPYGLLAPGPLSASRGSNSLGHHPNIYTQENKSKFLVKFFDYAPRDLREHTQFSSANDFDGRMRYWMSDWCENENHSFTPTELWGDGKIMQEHENLSALNIKLDLAEKLTPHRKAKALLEIKFFDQAYTVVLPQVESDSQRASEPFTLEILFVNERVKCATDIDRLRGIKLHTSDPKFDAVTQFLANGEMPNVFKIWKSLAEDMLRNKYEDPVAAAAGALVLVHATMGQAMVEADKQVWEKWLHNLRSDFSMISDGAVCDAWVNALRPGTQTDRMLLASEEFKFAVHSGLPIFTETVKLLKRGAEWAFQNEKPSNELDAIRWLTRRVTPGTALTTIRHEET